MKKSYLLALALMASSLNVYASREGMGPREPRATQPSTPEIVKWVGEISDSASDHTTLHDHKLEFKNRETGKTYDIVDSPELVKLHHENEKNYSVEIEAEKTPRFLFWGGNLIVKNFKVLDETASVPHLAPRAPSSTGREFRGGGRDR
jgi:hypothetical protein